MEQNQIGVNLLDEKDWLVLERLNEKYGYTGILQWIEDDLERGKEMCEVNEELQDKRIYSKLENKVRRLIQAFQDERIG